MTVQTRFLTLFDPGDLWRHCGDLEKEILMPYPINQRAEQFNLFSNHGGWSAW